LSEEPCPVRREPSPTVEGKAPMIPLHEILHTILGEGTDAGRRCAIVRTHGCNLKCRWCDTPQEKITPRNLSGDDILGIILGTGSRLALITGGEPLLHTGVAPLCDMLLGRNLDVILETNGSLDITAVPRGVKKIMDLKPPSSGFEASNLLSNITRLGPGDEIKIVIASPEDYAWARNMLAGRLGGFEGTVNFSPLMDGDFPGKVARWILKDRLAVRLNLQIHKVLFPGGEHVVF
jgi:7-carboxy-7-deazaguanine synthase